MYVIVGGKHITINLAWQLIGDITEKLTSGKKLEPKYRDHQLKGNWSGHRDCHIEADWILIYSITDEDLNLERTGSHSELFKK